MLMWLKTLVALSKLSATLFLAAAETSVNFAGVDTHPVEFSRVSLHLKFYSDTAAAV